MARKMIIVSTIYYLIGVLLGIGMSMAENHTLSSVHVHINLLGWVSMALGGIMYHLFPAAANSKLGRLHFWMHMIGIPQMMVGLAGTMLTGSQIFAIPLSIGGVLILLGVIMFVINAIRHIR